MLRKRLIPVLLIKDGFLVRSQNFTVHQSIGKPIPQIERYNTWELDELICLDISTRFHKEHEYSIMCLVDILKEVSSRSFMPLAVGGGDQID